MAEKFDAVVVGSGFGGGTLALRLAEAGRHVLVLERGRRWRGKNVAPLADDPVSTPFPELGDRHFFWGRQAWRPWRQRLGLYEMRQMSNLQGLVAAGVGGGSLIWANVVIEAPEWVFASGWPRAVTRASLEPYYRLADPYLRPAFIPGLACTTQTGGALPAHLRPQLLAQAAEKVGRPWSAVRVAVNFGDERALAFNGHGRARQFGCNFCGLCTAGCPQGAKNTVDLTYIAQAEALGAEVRTGCLVRDVRPARGGYRVVFDVFDEAGRRVRSAFVEAPRVILSAGTFGTTELLLRARKNGALSDLSPALGTRFSVNGNVLGGALNAAAAGANPATNTAPAVASMIDYGRFVIEDISNPTWSAGIVGEGNLNRALAFTLAWLGFKPSPASVERKARDLLIYVGVGADSARGRLRLGALGNLALCWPGGGITNEPVVRRLHAAMRQVAESLGRQYEPNVFSLFNRPVTYHPLGGCPMADNPREGVVDDRGRVYGYPGLYIADGSIVPSALGRNPSYTIAALSERVAEGVIEERS